MGCGFFIFYCRRRCFILYCVSAGLDEPPLFQQIALDLLLPRSRFNCCAPRVQVYTVLATHQFFIRRHAQSGDGARRELFWREKESSRCFVPAPFRRRVSGNISLFCRDLWPALRRRFTIAASFCWVFYELCIGGAVWGLSHRLSECRTLVLEQNFILWNGFEWTQDIHLNLIALHGVQKVAFTTQNF